MPELYQDKWITCTGDALSIRGYYFPWGTKRIPYQSIRSVAARRPGHLQRTRPDLGYR